MATNPDPNSALPYKGPYIDPAITKAPPVNGPFGSETVTPAANAPGTVPDASPADAPGSEPSGSTALGEVKVYDTPAVNHEPGDQGAVTPPHAPNSWPIEDDGGIPRGRDVYRNGGVIGQDTFLKNQGT